MFNKIITFFKGKKTVIVGICGFVYGVYVNNIEIILFSLGLLGLRDAVKEGVKAINNK